MSRRKITVGLFLSVSVVAALLMRAVTAHSVYEKPLIYRVTANNNDLDSVEGLGTPGRVVWLYYRQRNFKEGDPGTPDPFRLCDWKNGGQSVFVAWTGVGPNGVFRFTKLRQLPTTVMIFPPAPAEDSCAGGLLTQLLMRQCDTAFGGNCTNFDVPSVDWLNVKKLSHNVGAAAGSITGASQAAISVADGPDDGPSPSDLVDVDQNGFDTTAPGMLEGQKITWRCGEGGTATCPSVAIHDASTVTTADPEFPYLLGTLQGHKPGGSVFAAAAIPRGSPIGFAVNVNVKFRGKLDINLGCDQQKFFDFSAPVNF